MDYIDTAASSLIQKSWVIDANIYRYQRLTFIESDWSVSAKGS